MIAARFASPSYPLTGAGIWAPNTHSPGCEVAFTTLRSLVARVSWAFAWCPVFLAATAAATAPAALQTKTVPPVPAAALQKLLPSVDGWTSGVERSGEVALSPEIKYTFASVALTKDDLRVKLQLSDTGFSADGLMVLAAMIVNLPEDYSGEVAGAVMKRMLIMGSPAVESWDSQKRTGELAVIVGGRFVVSLEASKVDGLDTLRAILARVDLKALAALK